MESLHVHLFGSFCIQYDGQPCPLRLSSRLESVLTYLLLHSAKPLSRQHIAFQFWPDSTERQARNNLRKTLHRLRRTLPNADDLFYVDSQVVQWQPKVPYTLDIHEFESKLSQAAAVHSDDLAAQQSLREEAIALYQGDLLPNCYDEWLTQPRARLRQRFLEALEQLTWLAEEQRDYRRAISHAQHLLQHDPLHEATYRRLMRLHMLNGNRFAALSTYQTCVALIQRELNVEPGPEMQDAYTQILAAETPAVLRREEHSPPEQWPLVGRESEWHTLRAAWRQAIRGNPHFVLVQGEAGIGKTRLAAELLDWAERQGYGAAHTRSYAAEGALAYTPVTEWLRNPLLQPKWHELDHVWLTELARLLPELLTQNPDLPPPQPLTEAWQRSRLFEALARAVMATLQKPDLVRTGLLLVLDDLQWCDRDTLEWLHYLLHFEPQAPLLVLGTVRPEEVDSEHPLTSLLLELRRTERLTEVALGPLDEAQSAALGSEVATSELDEAAKIALYQTTEGSPLFIVETMRASRWQGSLAFPHSPVAEQSTATSLPPKVYATIQYRLSQLSPEARQLASAAAVIGRSFTFELLQAACNRSQADLVASLEELWHRGIVRTSGNQDGGRQVYDFSHDRIREVAYDEVGPVQRPLIHLRIAESLEAYQNTRSGFQNGQVAAHYELAGDFEKAVVYYRRAADAAQMLFDYAGAASFFNQALLLLKNLPDTHINSKHELDILLLLCNTIMVVEGFWSPSIRKISERAERLSRALGESNKLIQALEGLRISHQVRGEFAEARTTAVRMVTLAEQAYDEGKLPTTEDIQQLIMAHSLLGNTLFHLGELKNAQSHYERALALGNTRVSLWIYYAKLTWLQGYPKQARRYMSQALSVAKESHRPFDLAFAANNTARLNHFLNRTAHVKRWSAKSLALCASYGMPFFEASGKLLMGFSLVKEGKVDCGISQLRASLSYLDEVHHFNMRTYFVSLVAESYAHVACFSKALCAVEEALSFVEHIDERFWHAELLRQRGEYRWVENFPFQQVESDYLQAIAVAQKQEAKSLELRAATSLARLWQSQGRASEAHAFLSSIYNWFTEGFDTADLQTASALLNELSSQLPPPKSS